MSAIDRINKNREETRSTFTGGGGQELILSKDGDQAIIAIVPDGNKDPDVRLEEFARHSFNENGSWQFKICRESVGDRCDLCAKDITKQNRFGFWAWIYDLYKKEAGTGDGWVAETNASGSQTMYRLPINGYRVVSLPFGRRDAYWNKYADIYNDQGAMNKMIVKVKRDGEGRDTNWDLSITGKEVDWSRIQDSADDLGSIKDYYVNREAAREESEGVPLNADSPPWDTESSGYSDDGIDAKDLF